jgi:hypothetical protein
MQQRGTYLSIKHVHSHLEKDTPGIIPYSALAGNPPQRTPRLTHTISSPQRAPSVSPSTIKTTMSLNAQGQPQRASILSRHEINMRLFPHEGAIQRTYPMAHEHGKTFLQLPEFLLKFRHKMWLQRLPTWVMRHRRHDHEYGASVSPLCTTCIKNGLHIPGTMYHIFVECIGFSRSTQLRQILNNVYRKY